ncbi:hypothetical protein L3X38_036975 [Prunus dulcis]|uniref:Uncharacterized protein n=1 Tax=Prunus dulcis TaxID=3755 RepID=A0AAD4V2T2_PRUDU|nr:hypothetical protein L3X38_036975 [Prunus dulcis]
MLCNSIDQEVDHGHSLFVLWSRMIQVSIVYINLESSGFLQYWHNVGQPLNVPGGTDEPTLRSRSIPCLTCSCTSAKNCRGGYWKGLGGRNLHKRQSYSSQASAGFLAGLINTASACISLTPHRPQRYQVNLSRNPRTSRSRHLRNSWGIIRNNQIVSRPVEGTPTVGLNLIFQHYYNFAHKSFFHLWNGLEVSRDSKSDKSPKSRPGIPWGPRP